MLEALTQQDKEKYLQFGNLTQPFMDNDKLNSLFCQYKQERASQLHELVILSKFMHWNKFDGTGICCSFSHDSDYNNANRFRLNSQEIFENKKFTGCTDCATLFATFARQLGIPTSILQTVEYNWLKQFKSGADLKMHRGHTFCECFYDGKWILVDPTAEKINENFSFPLIELPYKLGQGEYASSEYYAYYRGLDLGTKMTTNQLNAWEEKCCLELVL